MGFLQLLCYSMYAFAQAIYYMDDRDSRIKYTSGNGNLQWNRATLGATNPVGLWNDTIKYAFDETITYIYCHSSDDCQMQVSFNGTGITLYMIQISSGGQFSITLDGGEAITTTIESQIAANNVTLFANQSLPFGSHVLTVKLEDWIGGHLQNNLSALIFDFAAINDTRGSEARHDSRARPIIGGCLGSLALILVASLGVFFLRQRARKFAEPDPYPMLDPNNSIPGCIGLKLPFQHSSEAPASATITEVAHVPSDVYILLSESPGQHLNPATQRSVEHTPLPVASPSPTLDTTSQPERLTSHSDVSPVQALHSTNERVDLEYTSQKANIPTRDIGRVIMIGREVIHTGTRSGRVIGGSNPGSALPPSYDSLHC